MTLDVVERRTLSGEIRAQLVEAIRRGELAPGSPLPAERTLCDTFGVARTSVREAIQGLIAAGYVVRRGNRPVVAERLPEVRFSGTGGLDGRKLMVAPLFEVRRVLEPAIAEFAAIRADDFQRAEIAALAATEVDSLAEFRRVDRAFHGAISSACANPLLTEVYAKALAALFGANDFDSLLYDEVNRAEVDQIICSSMAAHRAIAAALVAGHPRKTVKAVITHLDDVETRMLERLH